MPENTATSTVASEAAPAPVKPSRARRVLRVIRRTLLVLLLLVLALLGSLQTSVMRDFIRSKITSLVEANTNGTVSIGDIGGNFFTGVSLSDVRVRLKNDTSVIARLRFVSVRYSLIDYLFNNSITIHSLLVSSPDLYLHRRSGDSLWNYERFLKPSPPRPTDVSKPFTQTIRLEDLALSGGSLRVVDETDTSIMKSFPGGKKRYIRWSDLDLREISLALSGRVEGERRQYLKLDHLSLREANAPFDLYQLSLTAFRDSTVAEVKDLRLLTDHTDLKLDASLSPVVMLAGLPYDSLRSSATHLKLQATNIAQDELAQFIPDISFLDGRPSLDFEAEGPYGALKIKRGRLGFGHGSFVSFTGDVRNLHQPWKLYLDVDLKGHAVSDKTIRDYLPGLGLPDMSRFGSVDIEHVGFTGTPDNFATELDVRTTHGSVNGTASLDVRKPLPVYALKLTTKALDLAPIFGDSAYRSNINVDIAGRGSGFDPDQMSTSLTVDGSSASHVYGLDLASLHLTGSAAHGIVSADKSNVLFADGSHIDVNYITFDRHKRQFECDLSTSDVPIGRFVKAFPAASTISANATLSGDLSSINSITGSMQAVLTGLPYRGKALAPVSVNTMMQRDPVTGERSDVIVSDIADATFRGKYDLPSLGPVLADRFSSLIRSLEPGTDTLADITPQQQAVKNGTVRNDSIRCSFALNMKDLRALDHFVPSITMLARGKLDGTISGDPERLIDLSMRGSLDHVLLAPGRRTDAPTPVPKISTEALAVNIALDGLAPDAANALGSLSGKIHLSSDSVLRVEDIGIVRPRAMIDLSKDRIRYDLASSIEGNTSIALKGDGTIAGAEKTFGIDSLKITFSNGFDWYNESPSRLTIANSGLLTLDTLRLFKPEPSYDPGHLFSQKLRFGLQLQGDSIRYAFVQSPQLRLPELPRFLSSWMDVSAFKPSQGKFTRLSFNLSGTLSRPSATLDLAVRNVAINDVTLDSAECSAHYSDGVVRGVFIAHVDSEAYAIGSMARGLERWYPGSYSALRVDVDTLPVLLSFADYPQRRSDSARIAHMPASVRISARDYPLDMFAPFVPAITQLHGLADVTLSLSGDLSAPVLAAEGTITKGSFLVPFTNIRYQVGGAVRLVHSELIFDDVRVRNYPVDIENGLGILSGGFHFHGFDVDSFDLKLRVDDRLLVLNDNSKDAMKTIYGPLVIRSGDQPLEFHGTFDRPHLDGDLTITQAYLTLPQSNVTAADIETDGITYVEAHASAPKDTVVTTAPRSAVPPSFNAEEREFERLSAPPSVEAATVVAANETTAQVPASSLSFMDKMLYDMNVDLPGDCWMIITFPQAYGIFGTQLKAQLKSDGTLHFYREQQKAEYSTTGTLRLTERSSYTFIKDFSPVQGTMKFYKSLDNPTLDLSAEYTGSYAPGDVRIRMLINGTRNDPFLTFELWQKNQQGDFVRKTEPQEQQRNESFFFLATGMLPNDAGAASAISTFSSIREKSVNSIGSSFASSVINSWVASTSLKDYVRSVGIEYGGPSASSKANVTFGVRNIVFRAGISSTIGYGLTQDYFMEVPFSTFLTFGEAQNILFQAEGHNNVVTQSIIAPPAYLGRLAWRIPLN